MMIRTLLDRVKAFHRKHGFALSVNLTGPCDDIDSIGIALEELVHGYMDKATTRQEQGDPRLYRILLTLEEVAEQCEALGTNDHVALCDALGDRLYVLAGDAVTYDVPLQEVIEAIAASNDTKAARTPDNLRMRDKGPDYVEPDIEGAVMRGLDRDDWEETLNGNV